MTGSDTATGVTVGLGGLQRAFKRAGYQELLVQFLPGRGQDAARVSENLSRALFAANGLFRDEDAASGDFVFGEGAWPTARGAIALVSQASSPPMLERWLFALAAALEADGLRGKLTAAPTSTSPTSSRRFPISS